MVTRKRAAAKKAPAKKVKEENAMVVQEIEAPALASAQPDTPKEMTVTLPDHYIPSDTTDSLARLRLKPGFRASGWHYPSKLGDGTAAGIHFTRSEDGFVLNPEICQRSPDGILLIQDLAVGIETELHWLERQEEKRRRFLAPLKLLEQSTGQKPPSTAAVRTNRLECTPLEIALEPLSAGE